MANSVLMPKQVMIYLSLGSNLGNREDNLSEAIKLLSQKVNVTGLSSIYETEPVGYEKQPKFLNAVLFGVTELGPFELLSFIKGVESALGRVTSFPNGPRLIDVDILLYGDVVLNSPTLTIPHPRLTERAFVLVPLAETAPDLVHPLMLKKVSELAVGVEGRGGVKWAGSLNGVRAPKKRRGN